MTKDHLILIAIIELLILYLIVYTIKVARKWINNKIEECDELSSELPDIFRKLRKEMRFFNQNIKKKFIPQPLTSTEISSILGEIGMNFVRSKLPLLSFDRKIAFVTALFKLWSIRHRIMATFAQRFLKSAY